MNDKVKSILLIIWAVYFVALVGSRFIDTKDPQSDAPEMTFEMDKFVDALVVGSDDDGRTKESYVLQLKNGSLVEITNSYVTAKSTNSGGDWGLGFSSKVFNTGMLGARVGIPDFNPVVCILDNDEEKTRLTSTNYNINSPSVTVTGLVREFNQNGLMLDDCYIK